MHQLPRFLALLASASLLGFGARGLGAAEITGTVELLADGKPLHSAEVHHAMAAYILVLETPFHTSPGADGRFELGDVPEGDGTLVVWRERAEPWTIELHVPGHLDKFGKPYRQEKRLGTNYR